MASLPRTGTHQVYVNEDVWGVRGKKKMEVRDKKEKMF